MSEERVVYLNGEYITESNAKVSIFDRGFLYGDAVYDISRTYHHKPFRLRDYIDRLWSSLTYTQINPGLTKEEIENIVLEVLNRNVHLLGRNDDYSLVIRISRGTDPDVTAKSRPTVVVYCQPIKFRVLARQYNDGVHVVISSTRRTPPECVSPRAKIQNKINHILAELEAKADDPEAFCIMLDTNGRLAESSASNFFLVSKGVLKTSKADNCLYGRTKLTVLELAKRSGIPVVEDDLEAFDLLTADEAFLTGTSYAVLPISRVNSVRLKGPFPGKLTSAIMQEWKKFTGIDLIEQAMIHAGPEIHATA